MTTVIRRLPKYDPRRRGMLAFLRLLASPQDEEGPGKGGGGAAGAGRSVLFRAQKHGGVISRGPTNRLDVVGGLNEGIHVT